MEKIGVEVATEQVIKDPKKPQNLEKLAQLTKSCPHPVSHVYKSNGVEFCRKCEKYLKIDR